VVCPATQTAEKNVMNYALSAAAMALALAGSSRADGKTPARDPFPREGQVKWDVDVFERSTAFTVVKREVKGNQVIWILENKRDLGTEITFGYQAAFFDEDGVKILTVEIEREPWLLNMPKGERNRFTLTLPKDEKWQGARKVVIKNGLYE
jgi:hypothetical protein